jgi:hypothetical protein
MKTVECMEDEGLPCPKGETKSKINQKHHARGAKVPISTIRAKVNRSFTMIRKSCKARNHW